MLRIGKFEVFSAKSYVPGEWGLFFSESDRRVASVRVPALSIAEGAETDERSYEYAATTRAVRERLDVLGVTAEEAASALVAGVAEAIDMCERLNSQVVLDPSVLAPGILNITKEREVLRGLSFEKWRETIALLDAHDYPMCRYKEGFTPAVFADHPVAQMIASHPRDNYLFGDDTSDALIMRAFLEALPEAAEVVLDYTDLVDAGYYEPDEPVFDTNGDAIVLLTEGRTDVRVLDAALRRMYPHLRHLYSFFDFDDVRVEGGAGALCRTVRAFVAARIRNRMVALFDNDAAGHAALASLSDLHVPPNLKLMTLPDVAVASAYPTVGPQGQHVMNVNGLAASIEMYLGRSSLTTPNGSLARVEWSGLDRRLNRYQGELEGKNQIVERFLDAISRVQSDEDAKNQFPEMGLLLEKVFSAFRE